MSRRTASLRSGDAGKRVPESDRRQLLARLVTAQEEERRRVARELHDQTSQRLAALMLGLDALRAESRGRPRTLTLIRDLRTTVESLHRDLVRIALELRPAALDDLGLRAALLSYVARWSKRVGIDAAVRLNGFRRRLPADIETALYRIAQEALTNVTRHARAQSVSVRVSVRADGVTAEIADDGVGFNSAGVWKTRGNGKRLGLVGMRERAALIGGDLQIRSRAGNGTVITVRAPIGARAGRGRGRQIGS